MRVLSFTKKTVEITPIHSKTAKNTTHSKKANYQMKERVDSVGSKENSPSCILFNGRNKKDANNLVT